MVKDGALWQRYPARTDVVWAVSVVVNAGLGLLATSAGMHSDARPVTLSIGVGLLGEALAVGLRALSTGVPFSVPRKEDQRGLPNRSDFERLDRQPALRDGVTWLSQRRVASGPPISRLPAGTDSFGWSSGSCPQRTRLSTGACTSSNTVGVVP